MVTVNSLAWRRKTKQKPGFTIVELLIVIVVIAILAAVSIVAYNGISQRARESARKSDVASLQKTLELFKVNSGDYPSTNPNPGNSTWEISSDPGFMSSLSTFMKEGSITPPNDGTAYWYHKFGAGQYGCPASIGNYYILWVRGMELQSAAVIDRGKCPGLTLFASNTPDHYAVLRSVN